MTHTDPCAQLLAEPTGMGRYHWHKNQFQLQFF